MLLVEAPAQNLRNVCGNLEMPTLDEALMSYQLMVENNGIGISAPQVGLDKRFFWLANNFIVHPEILAVDERLVQSIEGCLSLPGESYYVLRSPVIQVRYKNFIGQTMTHFLYGDEAIVFQHEYDHLFGVMIDERHEFLRINHRF